MSFPSPQCRIRAVSLGLELHVSGARRCLARGSQEHGGQRRALVVGDGVCVGGERQQRAVVASALPASGGSEWRRWRLREEQTDRQTGSALLFKQYTKHFCVALLRDRAALMLLSSQAPAAHTPRQLECLGVLHTHHPTYLREAWHWQATKRQ